MRLLAGACIRARVGKGGEAGGRLKLLNGPAVSAKTTRTFGAIGTHPRIAIVTRNAKSADPPSTLLPWKAGEAI